MAVKAAVLSCSLYGPVFPQQSIAACCLQAVDENGRVVISRPSEALDYFAIRFMHSVALSPVTDYYSIRNCRIYLDKTIYQDFGAGLPHMAEPGQTMRTEGGEIILDGFNRELPEFDVRVGRVARHTLLLYEKGSENAQEIPFDALAEPGRTLHFRIAEDCPG